MEEKEQIIEMALCEVDHIFLRPGVLYRFVVMDGCEECKALAVYADEEAKEMA